jgi:hypothetical protein
MAERKDSGNRIRRPFRYPWDHESDLVPSVFVIISPFFQTVIGLVLDDSDGFVSLR